MNSRVIGGGIIKGKEVIIIINDNTQKINIILKDGCNDNL